MMTVPLRGAKAAGRVALIDDDDQALVALYRWHVLEQRTHGQGPYAVATVREGKFSRTILMHKLITGWAQTDHVNHDGLDNRRVNLRPATHSQNQANRRPHQGASSVFKGVHKDPRRPEQWRSEIVINRKGRYLGMFVSEEEAARAYDVAALEAWGEYACLNFPRASS